MTMSSPHTCLLRGIESRSVHNNNVSRTVTNVCYFKIDAYLNSFVSRPDPLFFYQVPLFERYVHNSKKLQWIILCSFRSFKSRPSVRGKLSEPLVHPALSHPLRSHEFETVRNLPLIVLSPFRSRAMWALVSKSSCAFVLIFEQSVHCMCILTTRATLGVSIVISSTDFCMLFFEFFFLASVFRPAFYVVPFPVSMKCTGHSHPVLANFQSYLHARQWVWYIHVCMFRR